MKDSGGYDRQGVAEFYDEVPAYRDRADVPFYVEAAVQAGGGPVLEVACGTGRVLIPIARKGVSITGIDLSSDMLSICAAKLSKEPPKVQANARTALADMRDFSLESRFSLATLPFRPFQNLETIEDQCACLAAIHRHLEPKGRLVLDLFNPWIHMIASDDAGQEVGPEAEFDMPDGRKVVRWHRFVSKDLFNQVNHMEMIYYVTHPDGRKDRLVHAFPMRYLFRFEAEHLLYRSGFKMFNVYSDFNKEPYGAKYPGELILVAEKA